MRIKAKEHEAAGGARMGTKQEGKRSGVAVWYSLTAWNWKIVQKPFFLICGMMAAVELVLLVLGTQHTSLSGATFDTLFIYSYAWIIFGLGYLAAMGVCLRPLLQGKSKTAYTVATLPVPRRTLVLSYAACTAAALCGIIALQIVLTMIYYAPMMALSRATLVHSNISLELSPQDLAWLTTPVQGEFALAFTRNILVRGLIPITFTGAVGLAMLVITPAVMLPCVLLHRGKACIGAIGLGLAGALMCAYLCLCRITNTVLFGYYLFGSGQGSLFEEWCCIAVLLVLTGVSYVWALHSVKRGKHL